jgi:hypothetical protein
VVEGADDKHMDLAAYWQPTAAESECSAAYAVASYASSIGFVASTAPTSEHQD